MTNEGLKAPVCEKVPELENVGKNRRDIDVVNIWHRNALETEDEVERREQTIAGKQEIIEESSDKRVGELYAIACRLEEVKFDWETKLRRRTFEIEELNIKVNDIMGHLLTKIEPEKMTKDTPLDLMSKNSESTAGQHTFALEH